VSADYLFWQRDEMREGGRGCGARGSVMRKKEKEMETGSLFLLFASE